MLQKICSLLVLAVFISAGQAQSQDIVHDPEFVRMEKEFGGQWDLDDAQVREELDAL